MGETKVEPGRDDPLEGEVVMELGRRQEVFFPVDCEGPGWIQTPQGESWPSTSLWVKHQFRRENGERLPSSEAGARGLDQSSPRSESDDDLSSAISRMAFSMGARLPLGVMPMGWMTCSLQPGRRKGGR